ncbi:MAG: OpgC domain-containing protein, partial [Gordonia sp. (in: high G+C Gram-positive bacteria)]|uniref:OpgC domain-containing protein n=1 Tax=Gordonia sp. (in: high G+C Gram-positive bacteria) TaxID=84139 RepID=UPI003BB6EAB7
IWSMVSLHFANGMLIALPTHAYPFVDGMSAFVLLSGMMLGIVHRRWMGAHDLDFSYRSLAKRVGVLYLAQLLMSLVAVTAGMFLTAREFRMLTTLPHGESLIQQLWWAFTMRFLPSGGSILVCYMVLMTLAFAVLPLLVRGRWPLVLAASLTGYVISQVVTAEWMVIYAHPGGGPVQNWLAWQVLFVPAMVLGWHWRQWRVAQRLDSILPALLGATLLVWLAIVIAVRTGAFADSAELIGKVHLGPVRALAAWLVVTAVYAVFRRLLQWSGHDWFRPLVMVGARSLDSYVIQALALVAIPMLFVFRPWGLGVSTVAAVAVFAGCWCWAEIRTGLRIHKLHDAPAILSAWAQQMKQSRGEHRDTPETAQPPTERIRTRRPRREDTERARGELLAP